MDSSQCQELTTACSKHHSDHTWVPARDSRGGDAAASHVERQVVVRPRRVQEASVLRRVGARQQPPPPLASSAAAAAVQQQQQVLEYVWGDEWGDEPDESPPPRRERELVPAAGGGAPRSEVDEGARAEAGALLAALAAHVGSIAAGHDAEPDWI